VNGGLSPGSNKDLATTFFFTEEFNLVILAVHFTELRTAVNIVRAAAGLSNAPFTDAIAAGITVRAIHLTELRTYLSNARSLLGVSPISYTDPTVTAAATLIRYVHLRELRDSVR
jgi:hypothetical protein